MNSLATLRSQLEQCNRDELKKLLKIDLATLVEKTAQARARYYSIRQQVWDRLFEAAITGIAGEYEGERGPIRSMEIAQKAAALADAAMEVRERRIT